MYSMWQNLLGLLIILLLKVHEPTKLSSEKQQQNLSLKIMHSHGKKPL